MFMREVYWGVHRRLLYLIALFVLAGLLLFVPLPTSPTYMGRTIENAGHTPLFFLLTMGLLVVFRGDPRFQGIRLYALAGLIGASTGFLSEVIQKPLARDASWEDVAADVVGVVCGLAVYAVFERRSALRAWHRAFALVVAISCIAIFLEPLVRMGRAYVHRNAEFPVLADFHSRLELYWTMSIGVNREIVDDALEVKFGPDEFPGVAFHEPVPDWRGYKILAIDVENPGDAPLKLGVRVHDRLHNRMYHDRFNRNFELAPKERRNLRILVEDIRHGPRERLMDMAHISDITLFKARVAGSDRLRVYSLRLE
jgi:VanZ family protein